MQLVEGQEAGQKGGGQVAALDQLNVQRGGLLLQLAQRRHQVYGVVDDQGGGRGQVVEQGGGLRVEIGQIPLDAVEAVALAEVIDFQAQLLAHGEQQARVEQRRRRRARLQVVRVGEAAAAHAQPFERGRSELAQGLAAGADLHAVDAAQGALGGGVEDAQAFDLVAEEVDAHGLGQVGRPNIDDAAAAGECARLFHHVGGVVAGLHPGLRHLLEAQIVAHGERAQGQAQLTRGQRLLHQGAGAGDDNRGDAAAALQRGERGQALLARGAAPADALVGQGVGFGKGEDGRPALFDRRQPLRQLRGDLLHDFAARGEEDDRAWAVMIEAGGDKGMRGLKQPVCVAGRLGEQRGEGREAGQVVQKSG